MTGLSLVRNRLADHLAIGLSGLCVLHCGVLPLFMAMLPLLSPLQAYESWLHRGVLLLILPISAWALARGCAQHGHRMILALGIVALMVLGIAPFLGPHAPGMELPLTLLASFALILSHVLNLQSLRHCQQGLRD